MLHDFFFEPFLPNKHTCPDISIYIPIFDIHARPFTLKRAKENDESEDQIGKKFGI